MEEFQPLNAGSLIMGNDIVSRNFDLPTNFYSDDLKVINSKALKEEENVTVTTLDIDLSMVSELLVFWNKEVKAKLSQRKHKPKAQDVFDRFFDSDNISERSDESMVSRLMRAVREERRDENESVLNLQNSWLEHFDMLNFQMSSDSSLCSLNSQQSASSYESDTNNGSNNIVIDIEMQSFSNMIRRAHTGSDSDDKSFESSQGQSIEKYDSGDEDIGDIESIRGI
jgi:hypothetical protein